MATAIALTKLSSHAQRNWERTRAKHTIKRNKHSCLHPTILKSLIYYIVSPVDVALNFIQTTQPQLWDKLHTLHGEKTGERIIASLSIAQKTT